LRHDAATARELVGLPLREPRDDAVRQRESAEEPKPFTALDGTSATHTDS